MAILQGSNGIKVEVKFAEYEYEWVYYHFFFSCGDLPLFNPAICKEAYFYVNDHVSDTLIPTLEEALLTDKKTFWDPTEPDMFIEIECSHMDSWEDIKDRKNIWVSDSEKARLVKWDEVRAKNSGKLSHDLFKITFFMDTKALIKLTTERTNYQGSGLGAKITVTRDELVQFVKDLKHNYKIFCEKNKEAMNQALKERGM